MLEVKGWLRIWQYSGKMTPLFGRLSFQAAQICEIGRRSLGRRLRAVIGLIWANHRVID